MRERIDGTSVTDFGALARLSSDDRRPFTAADVDRLQRLLSASWATFDAVYRRIPAAARSRKPGVGRSPAAMRFHLLDADLMHRAAFGPAFRKPAPDDVDRLEPTVRVAILDALASVPLGLRTEPTRRYGFEWTPRFAVRRAAWHALDHAWQLEDSVKRSR